MPASSGTGPGHRLKRWLYLVHRWLGIASCILFAMWFASGLVMIYVPYPELTQQERLAGLEPIDWSQVKRSPPLVTEALRSATLEMRGDRPVWRMMPWEGDERVVSAIDASPVGAAGADEARDIATLFGRAHVVRLTSLERDQWTVASGYNRHRPLWKAELAGAGGRVLYVSSKTGAVVLDTNARERFWNWLGSVPHWIYPAVLRKDNALWRQVVLWVSGPCIVSGFTGLWIGILRTRLGKRRFKRGRIMPYRGWMAWHYWAGMVGGLFLLTWIFSGWLSVDPGRLFESGGIGEAEQRLYASAHLDEVLNLVQLARASAGARQVEFAGAAGRTLALVHRPGETWPTPLGGANFVPATTTLDSLITVAGALLVPDAHIVAVDRLTEPDAYWYQVGKKPPLPVLRLRFDDPAETWAYVDPTTGRLLMDLDARRRLYRWLFDLLHKWDFNALILHRPAWDLLLWLLSLLGLVTSVSAVWIGWLRLTRHRRTPVEKHHA